MATATSKSKGKADSTAATPAPMGKSAFVKTFIQKNPKATYLVINEAWKKAGNAESVSSSLVHKLRSRAGLTGNTRRKKPAQPDKSPRTRAVAALAAVASGVNGLAEHRLEGRAPSRKQVVDELEVALDQLLCRVMNAGGFDDVETTLRLARRKLVASVS